MSIPELLSPEWMERWSKTLTEVVAATKDLDKDRFELVIAAMHTRLEDEHQARLREITAQSDAKLAELNRRHQHHMIEARHERNRFLLVAVLVLGGFLAIAFGAMLEQERKREAETTEAP